MKAIRNSSFQIPKAKMDISYSFNPFPTLFLFNRKRKFVTSLTPGSSPSDRYQTTLDRVWTGTMDTGPKSVTIRCSAPSGWLGTAPKSLILAASNGVDEQER